MFQLAATSATASNEQFVLQNTMSTFSKKNVIKLSEQCNSTTHTIVSNLLHKYPLTYTIRELSLLTYCTLCERQQETDISKWLTWYIPFTLKIQVFWDTPLCCCASSSPYFEGSTIPQIIRNCLPNDMASYSSTLESSALLLAAVTASKLAYLSHCSEK